MNGLLVTGCEVDGGPGLDVRIRNGIVVERALLHVESDDVLAAVGVRSCPVCTTTTSMSWRWRLRTTRSPADRRRSTPPDEPPQRCAGRPGHPPSKAWLRGVGYHESVAGALDCDTLDALVADRPVRVQHRSGALWVLNRAALRATGLEHARRADACCYADRLLSRCVPPVALDLGEVGRRLAAVGVTGVTDATPGLDEGALDLLAAAVARDDLPQRLVVLGAAQPAGAGSPAADARALEARARRGGRHELRARGDRRRHRGCACDGRAVAIHCVSRVEVVVAIDALARSGSVSGDRLEHASVLPVGLEHRLRELGVAVVTQPNFIAERGDAYAREVDAEDLEVLYRCRTLLAAGVAVAGGTDAPFGIADPWRAMRAAVDRRSHNGSVLGAGEAVPPRAALDLFLSDLHAPGGAPRRVRAGAPADLCLLREPLADALETLDAGLVHATIIGGRVVHSTQSAELSNQRASTS